MTIHSGILPWEIPWTEEPGGLQSLGLQKSWIPMDGSPPGSPVPGILQARVLEWGAIAFFKIYITAIKFSY